jgi:hypothetical protein
LEEYVAVGVAARSTTAVKFLWTPAEETAANHLVRLLAFFQYATVYLESETDVTISQLAKFVNVLKNTILLLVSTDPVYLIEVSTHFHSLLIICS